MKKEEGSSRLRAVNTTMLVLVLLVGLLMCLPFWHYDDQKVSMNGYVWWPYEHASIEAYFQETLGHKTDINSIVRMPALMFLPGLAGVILCLFQRNARWQMIATIPFGLLGVIGFLSSDALRLGSTWWLMLILCIGIAVVDIWELASKKE